MKTGKLSLFALLIVTAVILLSFTLNKSKPKTSPFTPPKGCVFRTVMGEESSTLHSIYNTPERVQLSMDRGLAWISRAQNANGGWGAGSHHQQNVMDPHAVTTDPATTAMVAMALLRTGNTLTTGEYAAQLRKAVHYLLNAVETAPNNSNTITTQTGTQIQTKLGQNIDVILTLQLLSNIYEHTTDNPALKARVQNGQNICVSKIQRAQENNGSIAGSGWAGVLQSSFAVNALEAAEARGVKVDKKALDKAREFQKNNYNAKTGAVNTELGAGVVLYSVTGSARASAKEARKVEEEVQKAKKEGRLRAEAPVSPQSLKEIGYDDSEAIKYATAYEVYQSAKVQAQRDDVLQGFGNNGGEEFLSYLQTGESMIINKDNSWKNWYDNMSGRLLKIQNNDGSWSGHHCITSPVFCTATCLLILSIQHDVEKLIKLGEAK
jgi:hypothetical protein